MQSQMDRPYNPYSPYGGRQSNPLSVTAKVGLTLFGVAVIGGAVYFGLRAGAKTTLPVQPALPPYPTSPPPGAPRPTPIPPAIVGGGSEGSEAPGTETIMEVWNTAAADVKLIHVSGENRPFHVAVANKISAPYKSGDYRFGPEEDARAFALSRAFPLGPPFDENDTLIAYEFNNAGSQRMGGTDAGGIWAAADNSLYITWNTSQESGQESGFADQAEAHGALYARLDMTPPVPSMSFATIGQ